MTIVLKTRFSDSDHVLTIYFCIEKKSFSSKLNFTLSLIYWEQGGTRPILWDETETEKLGLSKITTRPRPRNSGC